MIINCVLHGHMHVQPLGTFYGKGSYTFLLFIYPRIVLLTMSRTVFKKKGKNHIWIFVLHLIIIHKHRRYNGSTEHDRSDTIISYSGI